MMRGVTASGTVGQSIARDEIVAMVLASEPVQCVPE